MSVTFVNSSVKHKHLSLSSKTRYLNIIRGIYWLISLTTPASRESKSVKSANQYCETFHAIITTDDRVGVRRDSEIISVGKSSIFLFTHAKMDPIADATTQVRRFHKRSVELRRELGKGQFGKVYKACIREPNVPKSVAIKVIWPVIHNGQEPVDLAEFRKQAYSELYKMSMLKHENIVKLLGMVESGKQN